MSNTAADRAALREGGRIADALIDATRPHDVMAADGEAAARADIAAIVAAHRVAHLRCAVGTPPLTVVGHTGVLPRDRATLGRVIADAAIAHAVRAMIRGDATRPTHIERVFYAPQEV